MHGRDDLEPSIGQNVRLVEAVSTENPEACRSRNQMGQVLGPMIGEELGHAVRDLRVGVCPCEITPYSIIVLEGHKHPARDRQPTIARRRIARIGRPCPQKAFVVSPVERLLDHQMWKGFEADVFFPCRGEYGVFEHDLKGVMDDPDERALNPDLPNERIRLR